MDKTKLLPLGSLQSNVFYAYDCFAKQVVVTHFCCERVVKQLGVRSLGQSAVIQWNFTGSNKSASGMNDLGNGALSLAHCLPG